MKTTLEKVSSIKEVITVETTAENVDKAFSLAMEKIRNEAKIPGFRQGKVPDQIIIQRFGEELKDEAIKELARLTYPDALKETAAKPLTEPSIEPVGEITKGKPYTYKAHFEVYPEVTVKAKDYEGLKLEHEKVSTTDEEVESELKRLQQQMTQLEPVEGGEIGPGMVAMIDFKGTADGKPFPGSEAENYVVEVGVGQMLGEFEVQIAGMKATEEREIKFSYPKDYFKKEIADKEGRFKVKVKDVRRKIVPELNDDFAKELGNYKDLKAVRDDIKKKILEYKEFAVKNQMKEQAIHALIEKHKEMEVPTVVIESELSNMLEQIGKQLKSRGQSLADAKIDPSEFVKANIKEATDRARGYMLVNAITKQENLEVTDAEFEAKLAEIATQAHQPIEKVKEYYEKQNLLGQVRAQMLFEKTLDFVINKAKISETKPKTKK